MTFDPYTGRQLRALRRLPSRPIDGPYIGQPQITTRAGDWAVAAICLAVMLAGYAGVFG